MTQVREKITQGNFAQAMKESQVVGAINRMPNDQVAKCLEDLYNRRQREGLSEINEMILVGLAARLAAMQGIKTTS